MRGRSIATLIPAGQPDDLTSILNQVRAGTRVVEHETIRQAKDRRYVEVSLTTLPVKDAGGRVVGAVTIARDIRPQKRVDLGLRTSELRWCAIIESAVDGTVVSTQAAGSKRSIPRPKGSLATKNEWYWAPTC
jgi:hypothetical protein